jgi:hypothetical protein
MDVNALVLAGLPKELEAAAKADAAVNVKRVSSPAVDDYFADAAQGLDPIRATLEIKTTWHPVGW